MDACNNNSPSNAVAARAPIDKSRGHGDSTLIRSLKLNLNEDFILNLIRSGCDINEPCEEDLQPLHLALKRPSLPIVYELIKYGADINALDDWKWTPLQYAVRRGSLEATCMLLFHGADVTLADCGNKTPLINALDLDQEDVAEVLINYYEDFSCTSISNARALDYALWNRSRLAVNLVKAGADVNISRNDNSPIVRSFKHYSCNELFKAIWPKLDQELILNKSPCFLMMYLSECIFPPDQWLECLFLILSSSVAPSLVEECENSMNLRFPFVSFVLHHLNENKVDASNRLAVISLCMSLGATVRLLDMNYVLCFARHQFNKEVESIVYSGDIDIHGFLPDSIRPQTAFVLGIDEEKDSSGIFDFCKILIRAAPSSNVSNCVLDTLRYFSVSRNMRKELDDLYKERFGGDAQLAVKLEGIPEFPSLAELSRNSARKYLRKVCPVEKPYQFHDMIKKLQVPNRVKNIIGFKMPLY